MHKVIRQNEGTVRQIADGYVAINKITKDFSPDVSLAITEGKNFLEQEDNKYDRIYYILDGVLNLKVDSEEIALGQGDSIYITKGTVYEMSGTFKSIVINCPAFGTLEQ